MKSTERHDLRIAKEAKLFERNDRARKAIKLKLDEAMVRKIFDLSPTAYEQLAGQVKAS